MKNKKQSKKTDDQIQNQNENDHEFSEELSDGGERDEFVRRQTGRHCGGL